MKKKFTLILTAILFMLIATGCQKQDNTQNNTQTTSTSKNVKLGVLQLVEHPALDAIYNGLKDELAKQGYTISYDFYNAQGDQSNLATMSQKIVSNKPDVIVGITTPATIALTTQTQSIPIVMGGITYPVDAGLVVSEQAPGGNVTGVSDRISIKKQFELMKKVVPQLKTVGVLYSLNEENSIKQVEEAKQAASELGLTLKLGGVSSPNDLQMVTEKLVSDVDAIFVPIDNTVASAMSIVVGVTDAKGIGVFPSASTMVEDGGLLGLGVDQYTIGVKTAKMVIDVINGANPATTPVSLMDDAKVYVNVSKAKQLGITIPQDILDQAEKVNP